MRLNWGFSSIDTRVQHTDNREALKSGFDTLVSRPVSFARYRLPGAGMILQLPRLRLAKIIFALTPPPKVAILNRNPVFTFRQVPLAQFEAIRSRDSTSDVDKKWLRDGVRKKGGGELLHSQWPHLWAVTKLRRSRPSLIALQIPGKSGINAPDRGRYTGTDTPN